MILHSNGNGLTICQAIRQAVTYADVFEYPLNAKEIYRYLPGIKVDFTTVEEMLKQHNNILSCQEGYYTLPGREALVNIRKKRELIASRLWPHALYYGERISNLPFVRMVAVTGALAMNNVENDADVDYFIVTEPGHVWLTRAMILALGRFSNRQGIVLCPNYIVSQRAMVFPDKNLYAAHELAQMIPLTGMAVYDEICRQNTWVFEILPNSEGASLAPGPQSSEKPRSLTSPILEGLFNTPPFRWLEGWEMRRKIPKLQHEQSFSGESEFSADVCKGHMNRHQNRTDRAFEDRLKEFNNI
jgi:hypothetical protein